MWRNAIAFSRKLVPEITIEHFSAVIIGLMEVILDKELKNASMRVNLEESKRFFYLAVNLK